MAISFSCPHCGHAFQVEDSYAGQTGPCAACGKSITVPGGASAFAASAHNDPRPPKKSSAGLIIGILVGGFFALLVCGGVLAALLLPAIQAAREAARRNQCINNSKNLGLGLMNHHDIHNKFPLASTSSPPQTPGGDSGGYSWIVALLPYIEEVVLYDQMRSNDPNFSDSPFAANATAASTSIQILRCPSANDPPLSSEAAAVYSSQPLPGASNYIATSASHLINTQGPAELANGQDQDGFTGNGIILFPVDKAVKASGGLGMRQVFDGTSNTVIFCESKEDIYAAWADGQATWGVAAWPENVDIPSTAADGFLGWPASDMTSVTSLEVAREIRNDPSLFYMASSRFGGSLDRKFGPSSNHTGGVVIHAFADGHVQAINSTIDRTVYLRLFSRRGGEAINMMLLD